MACRKIEGLLHAGAAITVVAPQVASSLHERRDRGSLRLMERPFQPDDVEGMKLVFAATNSLEVNDCVIAAAHDRNILCSRVDGVPGGDFANMGIVQRDDLIIAISTGGDSPAFARWVRQQVESQIGPEYGSFLNILTELRDEVKEQVPKGERGRRWAAALDSDAFHRFCCGDTDGALQLIRAELGLVQPS